MLIISWLFVLFVQDYVGVGPLVVFCFRTSRALTTRTATGRGSLGAAELQSIIRTSISKAKRTPYPHEWPVVIEWSTDDMIAARTFFEGELNSLLGNRPEVKTRPDLLAAVVVGHIFIWLMLLLAHFT